MSSLRDDFRHIVNTFEPRSRTYWNEIGKTMLGYLTPEHAEISRCAAWKIREALSATVGQVIPFIPAIWFERKIGTAIAGHREDYEIPPEANRFLELENDELKDSHKIELSRREQFIRKAQAYLMAVTLGTSFTIGVLGIVGKPELCLPIWFLWTIKALLVLIVGFLGTSALAALRVIAPSESYDLWLQERLDEGDRESLGKKQLVKLIMLNQGYNLIAAQHLKSSYVGMRNGIALLLLVLLIAVFIA